MLIETGANQAYIFETNRLRYAVGASDLIRRSTTDWLAEALNAHPGKKSPSDEERRSGLDIVQQVSGKALALVDDAEVGRTLISQLSRRALDEAPGLELTGVVGVGFDETLSCDPNAHDGQGFLPALAQTRRQLERVRARRPAPALRDPVLPWHELCRESGLPAAVLDTFGDQRRAVAASVAQRGAARFEAKKRMVEILGEKLAHVIPDDLEAFAGSGWMAVVHADGNAVGGMFQEFPRLLAQVLGDEALRLGDFTEWLACVSADLTSATEAAFRAAVEEATGDDERHTGTLLPLIVGGDDITFICSGHLAVNVVHQFLKRFHTETAGTTFLSAVMAAHLDRRKEKVGLTASAGIAMVKPHHPFSAAYALAEALCSEAKMVKTHAQDRLASSFDVQIAFDSTLRSLRETRDALIVDGISRSASPYVVVHDADGNVPAWVKAHDATHLEATLDLVGRLSSGHAHDLRTASDLGAHAYDEVLCAVSARESIAPDERRLLEPVEVDGDRFLRVVDAMLLADVGGRLGRDDTTGRTATDVIDLRTAGQEGAR